LFRLFVRVIGCYYRCGHNFQLSERIGLIELVEMLLSKKGQNTAKQSVDRQAPLSIGSWNAADYDWAR
jgi:hypothetical protein